MIIKRNFSCVFHLSEPEYQAWLNYCHANGVAFACNCDTCHEMRIRVLLNDVEASPEKEGIVLRSIRRHYGW